eukprot:1404438-Pleurochrysis_carterae.AAC.2
MPTKLSFHQKFADATRPCQDTITCGIADELIFDEIRYQILMKLHSGTDKYPRPVESVPDAYDARRGVDDTSLVVEDAARRRLGGKPGSRRVGIIQETALSEGDHK